MEGNYFFQEIIKMLTKRIGGGKYFATRAIDWIQRIADSELPTQRI
jgi:hypothetical protein